MNFVYIDGSSGVSGDMMLGALIDLGVPAARFKKAMSGLGLPVEIRIGEARRSSLRGVRVDVRVKKSQGQGRRWADVEKLIGGSRFSDRVRERSLAVFRRLFEAEARVHGRKLEETHLHEAGADDAVIDIVGSCYLLEALEVEKVFSSPLNLGQGWVRSSHGVLPVPPPAVAELLSGVPVYSAWAKQELVTPTGAALVSTLAESFAPFPEMTYSRHGCGAGGRDLPDFPNILRVFCGPLRQFAPAKSMFLIETNIDDASPQILASFIDRALSLGAADVFLTPVVMKKNRLGTKLTLLAETGKMEILIRAVFEETTSIGIRYFPVGRRILERRVDRVEILGQAVAVKVAYLDGRPVNIQPEHSDCLRAAKKTGQPLKAIVEAARKKYKQPTAAGPAALRPKRRAGRVTRDKMRE